MIRETLISMQDNDYRDFQSRLIPNIPKAKIIGIRIPELRKFAKSLKGRLEAEEFLRSLPHQYYDEDILHGMLISEQRDFLKTVELLDEFLPYLDNWATCDLISPKIFAKHKRELLPHIFRWMNGKHTYEVRFGIGMLLKFFLDEAFDISQANAVAAIKSGEYYINMMQAWYFATALAKQYESVIGFLEEKKLSSVVHGMTIRKAIESYRISSDKKEYLRGLKF